MTASGADSSPGQAAADLGETPRVHPGKIVAVHLSYRSRAAQRGRLPDHPSYFLKPPNTVARSGDPVARPTGCELLAFEGEVALVIGTRTYRVSVEHAWEHVGWVTAANDFGVYDLRHADGGSNVRSKGIDGYTPLGPRLLDARKVDPTLLRVRTWVDGWLVQDATVGEELLFSFAHMVADLSRLMTLEAGDVILTGTPAGSSVVQPGQVVEVEVSCDAPERHTTGRLVTPIVEDSTRLEPIGAMPVVSDSLRRLAVGEAEPVAGGNTSRVLRDLASVSTATIASQLRKRGLNGCTLDGLRPSQSGKKLIGRARTLRYLPLREDLYDARSSGMNAQKDVVEQINPGEVLVISARGDRTAGTIGDILALRAQVRGAAGIVTDGAVRDCAAIEALDIPIYSAASHPAVLGRRHVPWESDVAVDCAGALVEPGDIVLGDADGVVVLPPSVVSEVTAAAVEQERQERFIAERVAAGQGIAGLYPIGPAWKAEYEAWQRENGER